MRYTVLSPLPEESVTLLRPEHLAFLDDPGIMEEEKAAALFPDQRSEDLSNPLLVPIVYEPGTDAEVRLSTEMDLSDCVLLEGKKGMACAENLLIGQRYYIRVGSGTDASETVSFVTSDRPPRLLRIDGIYNVRDVGGWKTGTGFRVKQGMIYRTSELDIHAEITERGKEQLVRIGVKTELDVRGKDESRGGVMDAYGIRYVNIPLRPYAESFDPANMAAYRDSYRLLLEDVFPLYIHCWGGIDRTGTWIFLLNGMLGVGAEDLAADYEFSGFTIWGKRSRNSDYVREFLEKLKTFGGDLQSACRTYMKECGLSNEELDRVADKMLE